MFLKRLGLFVLDTLQVIVFALSIFLFVYLLIMQPHKIKGSSMEPNFQDGEFLLTDKISYRFNEPRRGDVVVFKAPPDNRDEFIKRIIGLPGDEVSIQGGQLYINGVPLNEPYLPENTITHPGNYLREGTVRQIDNGEFFVLGDNRDHSLDSRSFGPIPEEKITGKAWFVYWPVSKVGTLKRVEYSI